MRKKIGSYFVDLVLTDDGGYTVVVPALHLENLAAHR